MALAEGRSPAEPVGRDVGQVEEPSHISLWGIEQFILMGMCPVLGLFKLMLIKSEQCSSGKTEGSSCN